MPIPSKYKKIIDGTRSTVITDPSEILANLIDSIPAFVWTAAPSKECTYFNRAWLDYRGRTLEEELIDGFTYGIHPEDLTQTISAYTLAFDKRVTYETEYRIQNSEGEYRWMLDRGMPVYHPEDNTFLGYAGTCVDIDVKKRLEKELHTSKNTLGEQYDSLRLIHQLSTKLHASRSADLIIRETTKTLSVVHQDAKITTHLFKANKLVCVASHNINKVHQKILEYSSVTSAFIKLQEKKIETLYLNQNLENDKSLDIALKPIIEELELKSIVLIPLLYQKVHLGWISLGFSQERPFKSFEIDALESIGKTVSLALSNEENRAQLEFHAYHDPLTGLANRAFLHQQFEKFRRLSTNVKATLLLIDLDRFKEINNTLGHDIGDLVLQKMSQQLSAILKKYNTQLIRLGGDEFVLILYSTHDKTFIQGFSDELIEQIRAPMNINNIHLEIDASIGIALYPSDGQNSRDLLRSADVAMYESKRTGNSATFYNTHLDTNSLERLSLISELRNGIKSKQLEVHYQPKMNLVNQQIEGVEALVRWAHPKIGLLFPDAFIPLAELSDTMHCLTESVLDIALYQQSQWRLKGLDFSVAINISARNLADNRCLDILKTLIKKYSSTPSKIELEITETALMQDPEGAIKILRQIANLGIRLSIDDFGTGYSSLAYLRSLPIDYLKIDRTFVGKMIQNKQDIAIVRSTISLAHNLNLKVIAEGVEDKETLDFLTSLGCNLAQGYYISKPVKAVELSDRFLKNVI